MAKFDPNKPVGMDDLDQGQQMPMFKLIQSRAAECDPEHRDFNIKGIPGCKAGDLVLTELGEIVEQPAEIIPLCFSNLYAEWRPKKLGGGLIGFHPKAITESEKYRKEGHKEYLGQNDLVATIYLCALIKHNEEQHRAVISFTSTNLKHGRNIQKQITRFRYEDATIPPHVFSRSFYISTEKKDGPEHSWYEYKIVPAKVFSLEEDHEDRAMLDMAADTQSDAIASLPEPQPLAKITQDDEPQPF